MDRQPTLTGELLALRPLVPGDFDALFAVASDPLIWEQHPDFNRWQEPVFRKFFDDAIAQGALLATDRARGGVIGSSRYLMYDEQARRVEIGFSFLARRCWGGRYNGEMKRLMLEHAYRWVDTVVFVIGPGNTRSRRAVEKIGGVYAGTSLNAKGEGRVVYELSKAAYESRRA